MSVYNSHVLLTEQLHTPGHQKQVCNKTVPILIGNDSLQMLRVNKQLPLLVLCVSVCMCLKAITNSTKPIPTLETHQQCLTTWRRNTCVARQKQYSARNNVCVMLTAETLKSVNPICITLESQITTLFSKAVLSTRYWLSLQIWVHLAAYALYKYPNYDYYHYHYSVCSLYLQFHFQWNQEIHVKIICSSIVLHLILLFTLT